MMAWQDIRVSLYSLSKAIPYALTIIATLGVSLGALVTMFGLNYQILLAPLPYPEEERIFVTEGQEFIDGNLISEGHVSVASIMKGYRELSGAVDEVALVGFSNDIVRSLPDTPNIQVTYATPEYFSILRTPMALGRVLAPDEGLGSYKPVAVISFALWERLFGAKEDVIGASLTIGQVSFKVIGVAAQSYHDPALVAPGRVTDIWLPWDYNPSFELYGRNWGAFVPWHHLLIKSSVSSAESIEQRLSSVLNGEFIEQTKSKRGFDGSSIGFRLESLRVAIIGDSTQQTLWMMAGALMLVLIAATNVSNLVLARTANHLRTLAIKAALGARKVHIFISIFSELFILISGAGFVAILFALLGIGLLKQVASQHLPLIMSLELSIASVIFTLLVLIILAFLMSLITYRQINYRALNDVLQASGKGSGLQVSSKIRQLLLLSQISLTSVLLVICIQVFLFAIQMINHEPGFAIENRLHVRLNEVQHQVKSLEEYQALRATRMTETLSIRDQLKLLPKVENASVGLSVPINYDGGSYQISALSKTEDFDTSIDFETNPVDENHLNILGTSLIAGRQFTVEDIRQRAPVLIVNQTAAFRLEPDGNVLHKRYYWDNGDKHTVYQVIGVVKDYSLPDFKEPPRLWAPQGFERYASLLLQVKPGQFITAAEINESIAKTTARYRVEEINSLSDNLSRYLLKQKIAASVAAALSIVAGLLAALGMYGVIVYGVGMRRIELGVRMAIGARVQSLVKQILLENVRTVVLGLSLSLLILTGLWGWLQHSGISFTTSVFGWLLPFVLVIALTIVVTVLSVFKVVRGPITRLLRDG